MTTQLELPPPEDLTQEDLLPEGLPPEVPEDLPLEELPPENLPLENSMQEYLAPEDFRPEADVPSSRYIVRTIDGLRMALAGFPANQQVLLEEGCGLAAGTIAELREIRDIPHPVEVLVPYRLLPESIVRVNRLTPEWNQDER